VSKLLASLAGLGSAFFGALFIREFLLLLTKHETPHGNRLGLSIGMLAFSLSLGAVAKALLRRS
jgi:hypothetical protein